ncbi:MAG TPA: zf-HC2 domain-containing protein [Gemmatimonadaceae bacterium]|nr:zf-HC2 domain-containing protein [Gemmatimonadaceae bacterium]
MTVNHLAPNEVAAYLDGAAQGERRARIETHLVECAECRDEIVDARRIMRTLPARRRRTRWLVTSVAAAAAVVIISLLPGLSSTPGSSLHRAPASAGSPSITLFVPVGTVDSLHDFVWSSVAEADRYHVRVFDANGTVVWERTTSDSTIAAAGITLATGHAFYWKVEADVGYDRHVSSELVEFAVRHPRS